MVLLKFLVLGDQLGKLMVDFFTLDKGICSGSDLFVECCVFLKNFG